MHVCATMLYDYMRLCMSVVLTYVEEEGEEEQERE